MTTYTAMNLPGNGTGDTTGYRSELNSTLEMMTNAGWVRTADTGQLNFDTVVKSGTVSYVYGYSMYYFNDSQHSTFPIYLKLIHTNSTGVYFETKAEIGHATDGVGNLMGWKYPWTATDFGIKTASSSAYYYTAGSLSIASWGNGYSYFHKNMGTNSDGGTFVGLQREWDDSTGAVKTGGNYTIYYNKIGASIVSALSVIRAESRYLSTTNSGFCMVPYGRTTSWSVNNADIHRHYHPYPLLTPSGVFCTYLSPDINVGTTFSTQLLTGGSARTFIATGVDRTSVGYQQITHRLAVLWE